MMKAARITPAITIAATGRSWPASRHANPAPTRAPTPSSPSTVVGACASAMKRSRATTSRAMASAVMKPLSRVSVDVREQVLLVRVDPRMIEDRLSGAVVEGGGGVGERQLAEDLLRGSVGVVGVDAEERDLAAALLGEGLEPGELEAAWTAPR